MGKPEAKPQQIKPKTKIGLILAENKSERNQFIIRKMQEEIEKQKMKLIVGNSDLSLEKQETQIKKMIENKVEIVIIQPLNDPTTKDHLSMLVEKNIKIITIDSLPQDITVDAFIAPDYLKAGQLQAQYLLNQNKKVTPVIFKGDAGNFKSSKMVEGNKSIFANNPLIENLFIKDITENNASKSHEILVNEFAQQPPDAIIVHDEEITSEVLKFIKELKLENQIMLLSLDINNNLLEDVLKGSLVIVDTMPNLLIQVLLETTQDLLQTETWKYDFQINNNSALVPTKYTPVRIIDKDNVKLLEERFPGLSKKVQEETKPKNQESEAKPAEKQTKLKIKLKNGEEYEVSIPGEIEKMEIVPQKQ